MTPAEIKQGLKGLGITQQSLAEELGVSKSMICKVISGAKTSARIMAHIIEILASNHPVATDKPDPVSWPALAVQRGPWDKFAIVVRPEPGGRGLPEARRGLAVAAGSGKRGVIFPVVTGLSAVVVKDRFPVLLDMPGRGLPRHRSCI